MAELVKLFNKGQRTITFDGGVLEPQKCVAMLREEADKLKRLFEGELIDIEDVVSEFKDKVEAAEATAATAEVSASVEEDVIGAAPAKKR